MTVAKNRVVLFHYTLTTPEGDFEEKSDPGNPVAYLAGHGNILPALEKAMMGKNEGEELNVVLEARDGYGERRPNAVQRVPVKHLITTGKLKPGAVVKVNTANGAMDATVIKVGKFNVDLDTNHPLAGRQLCFHVRIDTVRDAEPGELSHGHAHGSGGHHH